MSRGLRRGHCDGTVGVLAELGVPTGWKVTIAHSSVRRALFRIACLRPRGMLIPLAPQARPRRRRRRGGPRRLPLVGGLREKPVLPVGCPYHWQLAAVTALPEPVPCGGQRRQWFRRPSALP